MRKNPEIIIFIIAVFLFFLFGYFTQIYESYMAIDMGLKNSDSMSYFKAGIAFLTHFKADPVRPLGYPILVAWPSILDINRHFVLLWNIFLNMTAWALTSVFIFKTLNLFIEKKIAIAAAMLFLFCVGDLEYVYLILSETVFTFLLTAIVYFVSKYLSKKDLKDLSWAFILLCFSLLVRPTLVLILPFVLIILIYLGIKNRDKVSRKTGIQYMIISFIGLSLVLIQCEMVKKDFGSFTISLNGKIAEYRYLGAYSISLKNKTNLMVEWSAREKRIFNLIGNNRWQAIDSLGNEDTKDQLRNNLSNYLKAMRIDISANTFMPGMFDIYNLHKWSFFETLKSICVFISYWQNVILSIWLLICGLVAFFIKHRLGNNITALFILNWVIGGTIIIVSGVCYWAYNRYNVVCTPLAIMNIAILFAAIIKRGQSKATLY